MTALEADFQKNLDLLKRNVLDEADFMAANQQRKDERETLEEKKLELAGWLETQDLAAETATTLPGKIHSSAATWWQMPSLISYSLHPCSFAKDRMNF